MTSVLQLSGRNEMTSRRIRNFRSASSSFTRFRRLLLSSPLGPIGVFFLRCGIALKQTIKFILQATLWLVRSREYTNHTYDLTESNRRQLANWISVLTGEKLTTVLDYFSELENNTTLLKIYSDARNSGGRGLFLNRSPGFGRRLGWYALVRIIKPRVVVETGTDKGLGALVLWSALEKNNRGVLFTIDVNPEAGFLLENIQSPRLNRLLGDSIQEIGRGVIPSPDFFIHDSLHTYAHEKGELEAISRILATGSILISDNSFSCAALEDFASESGMLFEFFKDEPLDHWYRGGGIGIAYDIESFRPNLLRSRVI